MAEKYRNDTLTLKQCRQRLLEECWLTPTELRQIEEYYKKNPVEWVAFHEQVQKQLDLMGQRP